jgi:hypothetical protein
VFIDAVQQTHTYIHTHTDTQLVGKVLIDAVQQGVGEEWTEEMEKAWQEHWTKTCKVLMDSVEGAKNYGDTMIKLWSDVKARTNPTVFGVYMRKNLLVGTQWVVTMSQMMVERRQGKVSSRANHHNNAGQTNGQSDAKSFLDNATGGKSNNKNNGHVTKQKDDKAKSAISSVLNKVVRLSVSSAEGSNKDATGSKSDDPNGHNDEKNNNHAHTTPKNDQHAHNDIKDALNGKKINGNDDLTTNGQSTDKAHNGHSPLRGTSPTRHDDGTWGGVGGRGGGGDSAKAEEVEQLGERFWEMITIMVDLLWEPEQQNAHIIVISTNLFDLGIRSQHLTTIGMYIYMHICMCMYIYTYIHAILGCNCYYGRFTVGA